MANYGCQLMAENMSRVLMRRPGKSLREADRDVWHYNHLFDAEKAIKQYDEFAGMIESTGAEIVWIEDGGDGLSDAMFTRDASLITKAGAVPLRMGKKLRQPEPQLHREAYEKAGIPILGELTGDAMIEGGDTIWLNENTLLVGIGFRSNAQGVEQLNQILNPQGIDVLGFDMPYWTGEDACLHLMSVISPLTETKYLVHPPLIPARLWTLLKECGIEMVVAPADEFKASFGLNLNVLPTSPDHCIMIDGFPKTKQVMEEHGVKVSVFEGDALCMACEGGPTCLTNPILRG
ncbi:arginine deiminase family protein [Vibrio brasiliensis]|uniref:dimethylarginine dimethylaminohydrolase family protein n=1 Tax=Vibrio brasiliensis TaxID=170652 RepID=UPI001EFCA33A|nr:arginine deiminase family protein [Vibrio brasiliensis]MCG9752559.1 arginine deiminase family protein [Vibrio brasiliensis]MCG9782263.1 arginine deiminase family protein [Vibrio brasiliensis]